MLELGRKHYNYIVIDSPPLLRVADAIVLCKLSDAVVFVVDAEKTPQSSLRESLRRIRNVSDVVILPILTKVEKNRLEAEDYFMGYATKSGPLALDA